MKEWIEVGPFEGWLQKNGMQYWLDAQGEKGMGQGEARELNYCSSPWAVMEDYGGCSRPGRKAQGQ